MSNNPAAHIILVRATDVAADFKCNLSDILSLCKEANFTPMSLGPNNRDILLDTNWLHNLRIRLDERRPKPINPTPPTAEAPTALMQRLDLVLETLNEAKSMDGLHQRDLLGKIESFRGFINNLDTGQHSVLEAVKRVEHRIGLAEAGPGGSDFKLDSNITQALWKIYELLGNVEKRLSPSDGRKLPGQEGSVVEAIHHLAHYEEGNRQILRRIEEHIKAQTLVGTVPPAPASSSPDIDWKERAEAYKQENERLHQWMQRVCGVWRMSAATSDLYRRLTLVVHEYKAAHVTTITPDNAPGASSDGAGQVVIAVLDPTEYDANAAANDIISHLNVHAVSQMFKDRLLTALKTAFVAGVEARARAEENSK